MEKELPITYTEWERWRQDRLTNKLLDYLASDRGRWEEEMLNITKGGDALTIDYHEKRGICYALAIAVSAINSPEWCITKEED